MIELNSLSLDELRDYMISIGEKPFRGEQLFHISIGIWG